MAQHLERGRQHHRSGRTLWSGHPGLEWQRGWPQHGRHATRSDRGLWRAAEPRYAQHLSGSGRRLVGCMGAGRRTMFRELGVAMGVLHQRTLQGQPQLPQLSSGHTRSARNLRPRVRRICRHTLWRRHPSSVENASGTASRHCCFRVSIRRQGCDHWANGVWVPVNTLRLILDDWVQRHTLGRGEGGSESV